MIAGYSTVMGSDVHRDGMYLELIDQETGDEVAEVFYSDQSHRMTVSVFRPDLPIEAVAALIEEAKRRFPPETKRGDIES